MAMDVQYNDVFEHVMMNAIIAACDGNGVLDGLTVSENGAGADMSVDVAAGNCMISGTKYTESSTTNLAISAADATYDRKDLVVYDSSAGDPAVITGTAAATPIPPDIPSGDILLAIVDVAAGVTTIHNTDITDGIVILPSFDDIPDGTTYNKFLATERTKLAGIEANANNYSHPSSPACQAATSSVDGHATAAQIAKLNGIETNANNYSHPSSRQCSSGTWAWGSISGKPSTYPPDSHTHSGGDITSAVANATNASTAANADQVDGYDAGNSENNVAVSNGNVCTNLNADKVDDCDAGTSNGKVFKIPSLSGGYIFYTTGSGIIGLSPTTTDGYQLTQNAGGTAPFWSTASDLIFSDTHCPKCGKKFEEGDYLILYVIGHNEVGDTLTIPMHKSCAEAPKKTVMIKRKVMEDRYILDELTGELKMQRVRKTQKKTVTKKRIKEDVELDHKTGELWQTEDGKRKKKISVSDAVEEYEEEIDEQIYEDVEFTL